VSTPPLPFEQMRPHPSADPGFRLDPNGCAVFRVDGHHVDVSVRYVTEQDRTDHVLGEDSDVLVFVEVDVAGITVGRGSFPAEWVNPYSMREALSYAVREAVEAAERKVDEMARELAEVRAKREQKGAK